MHFVLSPEQYEVLCRKAKQAGLSKRALLVKLIEGAEIRTGSGQELSALRYEINCIGRNINQIAHSVNAGIARQEDIRRAVELMGDVHHLMFQMANSPWQSPR